MLSDHAPGLVKFCKDINILQFFCIRHIINSIGPMSFFGKLAMKLLMSQSEPLFVANYQYVMKNTNGCFQINKEPLEKVLKHCIISISDDQIVANPNVDDESLKKTVLVNRHISQLHLITPKDYTCI